MKLIIDTDPGIDDAMAYFYAHAAPDIDLVALTTVFGNVTTSDATRNALWLTEYSNAKTSVYRGASAPLMISPNAPSDYVHGAHGFGDVEIGEPGRVAEAEEASDYLVRVAREAPGTLTVCAIGPLTNIARAIQKDPDFVSNLKQLVIMGGSLEAGGNVTAFAEANFWNDPHAADIVVNAPGSGKIVIVGLDVTTQIEFLANDFADLAKLAPETGGFLNKIGQFYMNFYKTRTGRMSCHMHDPSAVIASIKPHYFNMEKAALRVETQGERIGMLARTAGDSNRECHVCLGVDSSVLLADYKQMLATCS